MSHNLSFENRKGFCLACMKEMEGTLASVGKLNIPLIFCDFDHREERRKPDTETDRSGANVLRRFIFVVESPEK
jgi:hypothetical protein